MNITLLPPSRVKVRGGGGGRAGGIMSMVKREQIVGLCLYILATWKLNITMYNKNKNSWSSLSILVITFKVYDDRIQNVSTFYRLLASKKKGYGYEGKKLYVLP